MVKEKQNKTKNGLNKHFEKKVENYLPLPGLEAPLVRYAFLAKSPIPTGPISIPDDFYFYSTSNAFNVLTYIYIYKWSEKTQGPRRRPGPLMPKASHDCPYYINLPAHIKIPFNPKKI